jgi:hypothetical protein
VEEEGCDSRVEEDGKEERAAGSRRIATTTTPEEEKEKGNGINKKIKKNGNWGSGDLWKARGTDVNMARRSKGIIIIVNNFFVSEKWGV